MLYTYDTIQYNSIRDLENDDIKTYVGFQAYMPLTKVYVHVALEQHDKQAE